MDRVQKLLANWGYCSRRKAEELIKQGRVSVNGKTITIGDQAGENDRISVDGKGVAKPKKIYLMFNKPTGCVTALKDPYKKTIMEYIKLRERVFPVGRLDFNTSGLLLLTNDGSFANQVMHPRYEVKKTYRVEINRPLTPEDRKSIEEGIMLGDNPTSRAEVRITSGSIVEISIHEGRNRIIRRMMKKLGYLVLSLSRVSVGGLTIGNLQPGKYRNLTPKEVASLKEGVDKG